MSSFTPTVRKRRFKGPEIHGREVERSGLEAPYETRFYSSRAFDGIQITESEGHPFHNKYEGKDLGGAFRTLKSWAEVLGSSQHYEGSEGFSGGYKIIDGTVFPNFLHNPDAELIQMPESVPVNSDLDAKGTEAISLCNPLNPVGDAATFLTETLSERLPSLPGARLWESRTKFLLGAADEFLNAEFGWMPMLREIGDFAKAVKSAASVMKQYQLDAGKLVRRSWYFPTENSRSRSIVDAEFPPLFAGRRDLLVPISKGNWRSPSGGQTVEEKLVRRKTWFKGSFTYPVPDQSDAWSQLFSAASGADAFNVAFGSTLTPETLWELTPWSWAIDWFSNTQEVIRNLETFEIAGLVMPYGYIMDEEETVQKYTYENGPEAKSTGLLPVPPVILTSVKKTREPANPFGFGLEWSDLSVTQLAILAALGITLAL